MKLFYRCLKHFNRNRNVLKEFKCDFENFNNFNIDLETKKRYEDFSNYSSESILETFYDMDKFGDLMKQDMEKYEALLQNVNGKNKNEILIKIVGFLFVI